VAVPGHLQLDQEFRPTRPSVSRRDGAADPAHRALREPEAQSGTRAAFGGEERLEEVGEVLRCDPRPFVGDRDPDAIAGALGAEVHLSPVRHRIARVEEQGDEQVR
jgi:hypothetical protein